MGGVGSFQRQNRTLYIGRIKETGTGPETEEVVRRHFKEWGEIEKSTYLARIASLLQYIILVPVSDPSCDTGRSSLRSRLCYQLCYGVGR